MCCMAREEPDREYMRANPNTGTPYIIAMNGGSSSIKFALFAVNQPLRRVLSGKVERIGMPGTVLTLTNLTSGRSQSFDLQASVPSACVSPVLDLLEHEAGLNLVGAVAHRIVHGGPQYRRPQWISAELVTVLRKLSSLDPDHLPLEISLIEACAERHPNIPQIACFGLGFLGIVLDEARNSSQAPGISEKGSAVTMPEVCDWKWTVTA
jgi:acetate kinase